MITIDGSQGEGGGQIIRSSLTLSAVTGIPFEIHNVRANRKKPGLLRQHLTAVQAVREICGAGVTGVELNSSHFTFAPGRIQTRGFKFSIGSAGSTTLVAQTLIPALMVADGNSSIEIEGGTHNMGAPPFDYLQQVYLPQLGKLGPQFQASILQHGFYPAGGGKIRIGIQPAEQPGSLHLSDKGGDARRQVTAVLSRLPEHIGQRELETIRHRAGWKVKECLIRNVTDSCGPGNCVMIHLQYPNVAAVFTGFGRKGTKSEKVAMEAWRQCCAYLAHEAPVDEHLADQLLLPLAIVASRGNPCSFRTGQLSMHTLTHIEIVKRFLEIQIRIREISPTQNEITIGLNPGREGVPPE